MTDYGINTQKFQVVEELGQVEPALQSLNADEIVIKAQVLTGGRGKGHLTSGLRGGVHLTRDHSVAASLTSKMLGYNLITHQTTSEGLPVNKVMLAEAKDIARETYVAIVLDRSHGGPVLVGSPRGGMDIEAVPKEEIYTLPIGGMGPEALRKEHLEPFVRNLGFNEQEGTLSAAMEQIQKLWHLFLSVDATQVEINPFGVTPNKEAFRQKHIFSQADKTSEDPREVEAHSHNLNYIGLDGNIGCMVNGAGLAMATMDMIKMQGGEPANFLDVGGSASEGQIFSAMKLLDSDPKVRVIFVNIFGGIMRCDVIAQGILKAHEAGLVNKPMVVRLNGTKLEEAMKMLEESSLDVLVRPDLDEAAMAAVQLLASQDTCDATEEPVMQAIAQ